MKGWEEDIFNNFIKLNRGFDLPEKDIIEGTYPVVASTSIKAYHKYYKVNPPAVVTGRSGSLGTVQYINKKCWPLNTSLYVKDFKGNYPKYVFYFLKTFHLENFNSGAGVPTLNQNHLHKLKIKIPDFPIQRKIAAVLSAYDYLIENNNRRIALLEKMAEELYREWFVRLRFPGHEKVKIVKGVPEGWEVKRIRDIVDRKGFGKIYRESELQADGSIVVIDQSVNEWLGYYDGEPEHKATKEDPIILFGDHSCKMQLMIDPFSLAENVIPFAAKRKMPTIFLFYLIHNSIETTEYKRHWTELVNKSVYVPDEFLQQRFADFILPNIIQKEQLKKANKIIKQSRYRLLSRLLSGKIDVENLDIRFPASMKEEEVPAHA